jgi:hypothetical protein
MSTRLHLRALADRVGILPDYASYDGRETRFTSDRTREAILAALRLDASTESAAKHTIEEFDRRAALRIVRARTTYEWRIFVSGHAADLT